MQKKIVMNKLEIANAIERLAAEIAAGELTGLAIVGIRKRGVPIAQRIKEKIESENGVEIGFGILDITLYRDDLATSKVQPVVGPTEIEFNIEGRRIVLVDDVIYTGRTVRAALTELLDFGRPSRIELAVLIDRGDRELPISPDYVGKRIETTDAEDVQVHLMETDAKEAVSIEKTRV